MKLTSQQIAKIEETLVLNGLIYDDIKLEVTDHIASEIEAEIKEKGISFDEALNQAFENWKEQLRPSSYSFWIRRNSFSGPRIVVDKCVSYYKSTFFLSVLTPIPLAVLSIICFHFLNQEMTIRIFKNCIRILYLIEILIISLGWILIWNSKAKTTFSYYFKKSSYLVYVMPLAVGLGFFPDKLMNEDFAIQSVFTYFFITMVMFFVGNIMLLINHLKTIKKFKLS
jgi:hypothetical protein